MRSSVILPAPLKTDLNQQVTAWGETNGKGIVSPNTPIPSQYVITGMVATMYASRALLAFGVYAMGLLTPALLFALLGRRFLKVARRYAKTMHIMDKVMSVTLCVTGLWLMLGTADQVLLCGQG